MSDQIRILSHLRSHQDEMVSCLRSSPTLTPKHRQTSLGRLCRPSACQWQDLGARVTILEQAKQGNHVKVEVGSGDKTILLLCHFDTVWNAGETKKRPFRVEDGKAYGPGVYDMKAGIVQSIFAVKTLKDLGLLPDKRIVILNNSDEEIGSHSSRAIIEEEAKKASAVLVLEPSALSGSLKTWRKGVGTFKVFINGRASHAGADYEKGVSAITEAAHQVLKLHGFTDLEAGTTVNVGVIKAGTRSNVVAEQAVLDVDLRVKTMDAAKTMVPKIQALKPVHPEVTIEVQGELNRPPLERTEGNVGLFRLAQEIAREMGIEVTESGSGGGSDGNFTSALGIPTLDGLGAVGGGAHALTEHVIVSSLPERAAIAAGLLLRI